MKNTPEYLLRILRKEHDLDENDKNSDSELKNISPIEKFKKVINWRLAHSNMAHLIITWLEDCGFTVKETKKEKDVLVHLFTRYLSIIESSQTKFENNPVKCSHQHLVNLCNEAINNIEKYPTDKLQRWLGFTQGVLAVMQLIDVDEEREYTRPFLHSYHTSKPNSF